jgi:hypothetical protein
MKKTTRELLALQAVLLEAAVRGEKINYQAASDGAGLGLDMQSGGPPARNHMARLLYLLALADGKAKRPLLSVLCVHKSSNRRRGIEAGYPGNGFWDAAEEVGLFDGDTDDLRKFADDETDRVIAYWQKRFKRP